MLYVCGEPEVTDMSEETPMLMYLNAHMAVDQMRTKNETEGKIGAKVCRYSSVLVLNAGLYY